MKKKMKGVLGVALTFVLVVSMFAFAIPVSADPDENEWSKFAYPSEGYVGDWFYDHTISGGPGPIAMAIDGTLYAYAAYGSPVTNDLFKSEDGGRTWAVSYATYKYAGEPIVDIVCSSEDADIVYVTDGTKVYWSQDAGETFSAIASSNLAGQLIGDILSLDVGYIDDEPVVFIADSGGTVWFIKHREFPAAWTNLCLDCYGDVTPYSVNIAPDFDDTHKLFAVVSSLTAGLESGIYTTGTVGAVEWSTTQKHTGTYSAKLTSHTGNMSFGAAKVAYGGTLTAFSTIGEANMTFWMYYEKAGCTPYAALYLDTDDDGVADLALLNKGPVAGTIAIEPDKWLDTHPAGEGDILSGNDKNWHVYGYNAATNTLDGGATLCDGVTYDSNDWKTLAEWAALVCTPADGTFGDAEVLYVAQMFGGNPACGGSPVGTAYVDEIIIDGTTYELGPTQIVTNTGTTGAWSQFGANIGLPIDGASDICFPDDFDGDELLVGVCGIDVAGSVYRVVYGPPGASYCLNDRYGYPGMDIISLQVTGDIGATLLLAGAQDGNVVWSSTDDGESWAYASKEPSGSGPTYVLMADDFADSGKAWAATSGNEGAVSYSIDGGDLFNQISLIRTDIVKILDVSFSPDYETSEELFLLTTDNTHDSLWRYDGEYWERVAESTTVLATTTPSFTPDLATVQVSPDFLSTDTLYIADTDTIPAIYRSEDAGQSWRKLSCGPDSASHYTAFSSWVVIDTDTVIVGGVDSVGYVYMTINHGRRVWSAIKVSTYAGTIVSFALSPSIADDGTILCGDNAGKVFISEDLGESWGMVGYGGSAGGALKYGEGSTYVAFDTDYASNDTIYAAAGIGINRFVIDDSSNWAAIYSETGVSASGIVTADGCVYVSDSQAAALATTTTTNSTVTVVPAKGGVLRSVNPTDPIVPMYVLFERVSAEFGLADHATTPDLPPATLSCLKATGGNVLWALDSTNSAVLWTYEDALVGPFDLSSPDDGAAIGSTARVTLEWEDVADATDYDVWLYADEDFRTAYKVFSGATGDYDPVLRRSDLSPGTEYWWMVRVTAPLNSKWSDVRSFSTALGTMSISTDFFAPVLGATDVPLKPAFAWEPVGGATSYKFQLADNNAFATPMVDETLTATVYQLATDLDYSTAYYWRVKAVSATTESNWATGDFITMAEPVTPPEPLPPVEIPPLPAPITPLWIYVIIGIGAALVIAVIVLIVTTRRVP